MPDPLLLALGAAAALVLARLVPRAGGDRLPGLGAGLGLVLLLVAALRALGEAAQQLAAGRAGLAAAAVAVGVAVWLLAPARPPLRASLGAAAVVLAQAPLLAALGPFDLPVDVPVDLYAGPQRTAVLLVLGGLLAGGAVAACRPPLPVAVACVALLAGGLVLAGEVDPDVLGALGAGLAVAVLVPLLLERAAEAAGPWRARGALLGLVLVLAVAALPAALPPELPRRYADYQGAARPGLQVLSNDQFSRLALLLDEPSLVPGLPLLTGRAGAGGRLGLPG